MSNNYNYWTSRYSEGRILEYVTDKRLSAKSWIQYMLIRLQKMFKYKNVPDSIPVEVHENYLMQNGTAFITKVNGELYSFEGSMGGEPDPYYRPTLFIVSNPALKFNESLDIQKDGVLMRNDTYWYGLVPILSRYAALIAENFVTLRTADVMLRIVAMLSAPDDKTKIAAELYLKKLEKGELGVIGENPFFDGVKMQSPPTSNGSYLTQFIELHQYLKASFFNEVGLDANYNMKREAIAQGESALNEDSLLPLVENMLLCRQEDTVKVNDMYGTNISVDFDSSWKQNVEEMKAELEAMRAESDSQLTGSTINAISSNDNDSQLTGSTSSLNDSQLTGSLNDNDSQIVQSKENNNDNSTTRIYTEDVTSSGENSGNSFENTATAATCVSVQINGSSDGTDSSATEDNGSGDWRSDSNGDTTSQGDKSINTELSQIDSISIQVDVIQQDSRLADSENKLDQNDSDLDQNDSDLDQNDSDLDQDEKEE